MADGETGQVTQSISMYLPLTCRQGQDTGLWRRRVITVLILQKLYTEYELQGMEAEKLNTNFYVQVSQRMATEEATCVLSNADQADTG